MRYRDTKTGRFAKKSTWTRSHAQGGTRYKRERTKPRELPEEFEPEEFEPEEAELEEDYEYEGAFDSP